MATPDSTTLGTQLCLAELQANSELDAYAHDAATATVLLRQKIAKLIEAHTGLNSIGCAISMGNLPPHDLEGLGFAVVSAADHIDTLVESVEDHLARIFPHVEIREVQS